MLIVNFNGVLMDDSWNDPYNFRPERFLDNDNNVVTPEKFFPFGIGASFSTVIVNNNNNKYNVTLS